MNKRVIFSISLILLIGLAVFVSATRGTLNYPGTTTETDVRDVTLNLEEGWNMIHGFANPEWIISGDISASNIKAIYALNPQSQQYVRFFPQPESDKISGSNFRWDSYISQDAFWVYSDKKGSMTYKTQENTPVESAYLLAGWNLFTISPEIIGKSFEQIKGNCNISKVYGWDSASSESTSRSWINFPLDEDFYVSTSFVGLAVKVSENCKLGTPVGEIPSVPQMPN